MGDPPQVCRREGDELAGISVTTVAQTLCDVAVGLEPWPLERSTDHALLEGKVTIADRGERLQFYDGSPDPGSAESVR